MENGQINGSQVKASSSYDDESTGPQNSRIRTTLGGGAWCPKNQINITSTEWLQITFPTEMLITAVETQGRDHNGEGAEFAQAYRIEYLRPSLDGWARYRDGAGKETIPGNTDPRSSVHRELDGPIIAKQIRFVPISNRTRTVCMRVEVYGCPYTGRVLQYSVAEGSVADGLSMKDHSYDGKISPENILFGGVGKLFDGKTGEDDFEKFPNAWMGWRADEHRQIELNFTFTEQMNMSMISIYTSNFYKHGAEIFSTASVYFSQNGIHYSSRSVAIEQIPDKQFDSARWLRIPIPNRIAKYLKIEIRPNPEAHWLLISEVQFVMSPVLYEWDDHSAAIQEEYNAIQVIEGTYTSNNYVLERYWPDPEDHSMAIFIVSMFIILTSICSAGCCIWRLLMKKRTPRVSPSTYEMARDNAHNILLEKIPMDGEYADPDFSIATNCDSRMPLLGAYRDFGSPGSVMRRFSSPSTVSQYADYGEVYVHTSPEIDPSQLQFVRKLDGEVRNAKLCQLERRLVVVKSLDNCEDVRRELQYLGALKHPNVLEMIGVSTGQPFFCVLEYAENGKLDEYFKKMERVDTQTVLSTVVNIVAGLAYLESRSIILSHLAAHTCLVDKDGNPKITRMGHPSQIFDERCCSNSEMVRWMAPEAKTEGTQTQKSNVYSFGVLCWELFGGCREKPPVRGPGAYYLPPPLLMPDITLHNTVAGLCLAENPDNRKMFNYIHLHLQTILSTYI
ncbi:unnamed protein product, partial [Mesorhabditis spiculigera]